MIPVRVTLRNSPRPGWTFLMGGTGAGDEGMYLTQTDDRGRVWLSRLWSLGPLMVSLDVHVPWEAAASIGRRAAAHEAAQRTST